jgi:hypothetical protein
MPSDDLVLNVRQIAGYPPATTALSSDAVVMQRVGVGGPYVSISPTEFVATALSAGGDMAIGGRLSVGSLQGGSAQFSNAAFALLGAQTANIVDLTATWGTIDTLTSTAATFVSAQLGTLSVSGDMQLGGTANLANAVVQANLSVGGATLFGDLTVNNLAVCNIATITTGLVVEGNFAVVNGTATVGGYPIVTTGNSSLSGLAPLDSPAFTGTPTAPTPADPSDNSATIPNTRWTVALVNSLAAGVSAQFAPLASPNFSGVPAGPTAAPGNSTAQLATTAFVQAAVAASTAGVASFNGRVGAVVFENADLTAVGGALLDSPVFTGFPSAPTATTGNASGLLATTQFVQNTVAAISLGVTTFNSRSGAVTLTSADITGAGGALAASAGVSSFNGRSGAITLTANDVSAAGALVNPSPALTGVPTAPTAAPATNTTQLATTAFVTAALAAVGTGVISFNGRSGAVNLTLADVTGVNGAPINSPSFSGTPLAPAPAPATNTNQIATCAWVLTELGGATIGVTSFNGRGGAVTLTSADITGAGGALAGAGVTSFNSRTGAITLTANDISAAGGAPLASPAFTGAPTAPTATGGTNSTQLATTAFVTAAIGGAPFLPLGGGTLTGTLALQASIPVLNLIKSASGGQCVISGQTGASTRWQMALGNTTAESGSNAGSDFTLTSFGDTGAVLATALSIARATSAATFGGSLTAAGSGNFNGSTVNVTSTGGSPTVAFWTSVREGLVYYDGTLGFLFQQLNNGTYLQLDLGANFAYVGGTGQAIKNGGGAWTAASDARIKTVHGDYEDGLDAVLAMRPVRYTYKGNDSLTASEASPHAYVAQQGTPFVGFVAQELETVAPDMVSQTSGFIDGEPVDDLRNVDVSNLVFALVNAVKTLAARVTALEAA